MTGADLDGLELPQPPPWPEYELNQLACQLFGQLTEGVTRIMREAGEDPSNHHLLTLRCRQVAYSINSQARRAWTYEIHTGKVGQ